MAAMAMTTACLASTTRVSSTSSSFVSSSSFPARQTLPKAVAYAGRTSPARVVVGFDGGVQSAGNPGQRRESLRRRIVRELRATGDKPDQTASSSVTLFCQACDGNGAVACSQCQGDGLNLVDHFDGRFKAGTVCWLCRGKRQMLCGSCNGAGFLGGFMNTQDE